MSTVTIYSKRDEHGRAALEDCTLVTGFGPVSFSGGQAEVTPEQASILTRANPNIELRQANGYLEAGTVAAAGPALPVGLMDASDDELSFAAEAIAAVRAGQEAWVAFADALQVFQGWVDPPAPSDEVITPPSHEDSVLGPEDDGGELEPAPGGAPPDGGGDGDPTEPHPEDLKLDPSIAAAQAMLRDENEHVPKALPNGFEATTGEGEVRCYARKGDGSQCTNPAKPAGEHSSYACGLGTHVEQVSKLP